METDVLQWTRVGIAGAQLLVSGVGLVAILVGLVRMKEAGTRRDREIDIMATNMQESTRMIGQALERQNQALERQGQALERQGAMMTEALHGFRQQSQALERQNQALERQGQALERQGRALEELLRRSA